MQTLRLAAFMLSITASAQPATKPVSAPPPTGTVTGHVTCSDTQRAARFASVSLLAKEQPEWESAGKLKQTSMSTLMVGDRSGIDGNFTIKNVPVGDYYVIGVLAGYVFPASTVSKDAPPDIEQVLANVPLVHVLASQTVTSDIVLQRGAVLAGRVTYEDGTPAAGFMMKLQALDGINPMETGRGPFQLLSQIGWETVASRSDDAGRYRIAGVAPGKYRVMTELVVEGGGRYTNSTTGHMDSAWDQQWMDLYAPGVFHKSDAKVIEIKGGEEDTDLDLKVALESTHSLAGHVMAKEDRHVPNHIYVRLTEKSDPDFRRNVSADSMGAFHFSYVPGGTYTLSVNTEDGAPPEDMSNPYDYKTLQQYKSLSVDAIVDKQDVDVGDLIVDKEKPEGPKPDAPTQ